MSLHRIAVISDTHNMLRPELIDALRSVERTLHAGDIASREMVGRLDEIAPLTVVRGNCDRDWAWTMPLEVSLELYGKKIYMIHNKAQISSAAKRADIIIYGHSHKYEEKVIDGRLWLNPGSCGPRRFGRPATMAVLEIDEETGDVRVNRMELSEEAAGRQRDAETAGCQRANAEAAGRQRDAETAGRHRADAETAGRQQDAETVGHQRPDAKTAGGPADFENTDLRRIVTAVVRELEKGRTVERIMKTQKISRALTEQICQIYFTHPGIDVQGVLDRMEIAGL